MSQSCERCGSAFIPRPQGVALGQRCCSGRCARIAANRRRRERRLQDPASYAFDLARNRERNARWSAKRAAKRPKPTERTCLRCSTVFVPTNPRQKKFCSKKCCRDANSGTRTPEQRRVYNQRAAAKLRGNPERYQAWCEQRALEAREARAKIRARQPPAPPRAPKRPAKPSLPGVALPPPPFECTILRCKLTVLACAARHQKGLGPCGGCDIGARNLALQREAAA